MVFKHLIEFGKSYDALKYWWIRWRF